MLLMEADVLSTMRLISFGDIRPSICGFRRQSLQWTQTAACKPSRATEYCGRRLEPDVTQNSTLAFAMTYRVSEGYSQIRFGIVD